MVSSADLILGQISSSTTEFDQRVIAAKLFQNVTKIIDYKSKLN